MDLFSLLRHIARYTPLLLATFALWGCSKVEQLPKNSDLTGKETASRPEREVKFDLKKRIVEQPASTDSKTPAAAKPTDSTIPTPTTEEQGSAAAMGENNEGDAAEEENSDASDNAEAEAALQLMENIRALGPPLVLHPEDLRKVHPVYPVWINVANKQVVMVGEVCQTEVPLEMFACLRGTKEHESVVTVPTEAFIVHSALLAIGAKPGAPVQYVPNYIPARGTEIDISVRWKNRYGEVQIARAQDWVRDFKTGRVLDQPWVFAGSGFWRDESTGKEYYKAEGGDFICVANFPSAMLDLPIRSSESNAELLFQAYKERIPPRGTPVTLILTPRLAEAQETPLPAETREVPIPVETDEVPLR